MRELLDKLIEEMVDKGIHYEDACAEFDRRFIARILTRTDGNLTRAADVLGIHRNTLARKVAQYRIRHSR